MRRFFLCSPLLLLIAFPFGNAGEKETCITFTRAASSFDPTPL